MAWIESHQELARHPKTRRLARLLSCCLPQAVGHLQFLWWWALDYAPDGDLSAFTDEDIAEAVMWEGDADMCAALTSSGFLDDDRRIHNWADYTGRLISTRVANRAASLDRTHQRRARIRGSVYVKVSRAEIFERDAHQCYLCGRGVPPGFETIDHVVPLARGGAHVPDNLRLACRSCNSRKGTRLLGELRGER